MKAVKLAIIVSYADVPGLRRKLHGPPNHRPNAASCQNYSKAAIMSHTNDPFAKKAVIDRLEKALDLHQSTDLATQCPGLRPAAVLIPLVWRRGEGHLIFTERTTTVKHHKGQISFPGGSFESSDPDLLHCALRETNEELSLTPERVLGALDQLATPSGFRVAPFVGIVADDATCTPDPREVANVIEIPLHAIVAGFRRRTIQWRGVAVQTDAVEWNGVTVWGVTGMILRSFLHCLNPDPTLFS